MSILTRRGIFTSGLLYFRIKIMRAFKRGIVTRKIGIAL
jgi:hypothetical protein